MKKLWKKKINQRLGQFDDPTPGVSKNSKRDEEKERFVKIEDSCSLSQHIDSEQEESEESKAEETSDEVQISDQKSKECLSSLDSQSEDSVQIEIDEQRKYEEENLKSGKEFKVESDSNGNLFNESQSNLISSESYISQIQDTE